MKILAYDPYMTQQEVDPLIEVTGDWKRVFREADFVSLNFPLNEKTWGIIGKKGFGLMKDILSTVPGARLLMKPH